MNISCVIVDDETPAVELLEKYVSDQPNLFLTGTFTSSVQAYQHIQKEQPELVFLDINMPGINGLELAELIKPLRTKIVFTTAHDDFALRSYEYDVIDYLLKPFSYARFLQALGKFTHKNYESKQSSPYLQIICGTHIYNLERSAILFFESQRNMIYAHLRDDTVTFRTTMKELKAQLDNSYCQIHKSFIVRYQSIRKVGPRNVMLIDGRTLPISDTARTSFEQWFKQQGL